MKKLIIFTAVCCMLLTAGCGSRETKDIKKTTASAQLTATGAEDISTDGETEEKFSIPPRETFAEIPAEAEKSFDCVMKTVDKTFPKKKKSIKRYYGYLGEEQIENALSYVFAVYDSKDDNVTPVVTAAVTADRSKVYVLDEESGQYWLIEKFAVQDQPEDIVTADEDSIS